MKLIVKRILIASMPVVLAAGVACTGPAEGSIPPTISPDIFAPIPTPRPFGQTPTPTATPFLLPVPTVAITATDEPTVQPTATPSSTVGAPGPEPTSEASTTPEPTVALVPTPTAEATQASTETPTPETTTTPEPTATPVPALAPAPGGVVFSLDEGAIILQTENSAPESIAAGTDLSNFSVSATFGNPVRANFRPFSYGVKFRESGGEYQAVAISSTGSVRYLLGTTGEEGSADSFTVLETFSYDEIGQSGGDSNSLHLTVIDDKGWLFVNDEFVSEFTVSGIGVSADVELIAELENETGISGAITDLTGAEVRSAAIAAFEPEDTLVKEQGKVSRTEPTGVLRDSMVEAEFISPYERILGRWSVGFEYIEPNTGTANWIIFNNSQQWKHLRRDGATGGVTQVAMGTAGQVLRERNDVNSIMMLGRNGTYEVFINDEFVTTVTIDPLELPVQVSAIAGAEDSDQQPGFPTRFTNYTVWSFGS